MALPTLPQELQDLILPQTVGEDGQWVVSEHFQRDNAGRDLIKEVREMTDVNLRFSRGTDIMAISRRSADAFPKRFFSLVNTFVIGKGQHTELLDRDCDADSLLLLKLRMAILFGTLEAPAGPILKRVVFASIPATLTVACIAWLYARGVPEILKVFKKMEWLQICARGRRRHAKFDAIVRYAAGVDLESPAGESGVTYPPSPDELRQGRLSK